jgi:hypothetical protein
MQPAEDIHRLLTSAVRHFPLCNEFGFVFTNLRQQLGAYGLDGEEADDALLRAAGAVFAERVTPGTLVGSEVDALAYIAMVRALLDARKRPAEEDSQSPGFARTSEARETAQRTGKPSKKPRTDLEEGELDDTD